MGLSQHQEMFIEGRGKALFVVTLVFSLLSLLLVASRLVIRRYGGKKVLHLDDYAIVTSLVCSLGLGAANILGVLNGYGEAWGTLSPKDATEALVAFFALQVCYKLTISFTKISILLLYRQTFAPRNTTGVWLRRSINALLAFVVAYGVASLFATGFQCWPTRFIWDKSGAGHCINLQTFWYANAGANIAGDFVILVLPLHAIWHLQIPRRQKWVLCLVFALGLFVCTTSLIRVTTLQPSSTASDQTYGTYTSTVWTCIEANTGIICACLPMLKGPISHFFPHLIHHRGDHHSAPRQRTSTPQPLHDPRIWSTEAGQASNPSFQTQSTADRSEGREQSFLDFLDMPGESAEAIPLGAIVKKTTVSVDLGRIAQAPMPAAHLAGREYQMDV